LPSLFPSPPRSPLFPYTTLFRSAGIASRGRRITDTDPAEVGRVIGTHAVGAHYLCQLVVPIMREAPRGDIIMISSATAKEMAARSEEHTSELQSPYDLVCRLLLE